MAEEKSPFSGHLHGKVAVFIDAANIIYCQKDLGWKIDFKKIKKHFDQLGNSENVYFYSAYLEESAGQKSFFEMLSRKGFIMRLKKLKKIKNNDGTFTLKGNCDTDLVVDAIASLQTYDTAVLFSGDGDFVSLVNLLRGNNKRVITVSTRWHIAKDLVDVSHVYIDLRKCKSIWSRNSP